MVILGSQNKITDFLLILAWASPFKYDTETGPHQEGIALVKYFFQQQILFSA